MVFNLDYSQYLTTYFLQQAHHVHQIYEKCVKESRKKNKKSDNSLPKCINFLIHYSFKITKTMNWSNDQTTRQNITNFKKGNNKGIIFGILVVSYKLCYNHLLFLSLPFSPFLSTGRRRKCPHETPCVWSGKKNGLLNQNYRSSWIRHVSID